MDIQHTSLLLVVILTSHLFISNGSELNDKFLTEAQCISSAGDQEMCNAYLDLVSILPEKHLKPYYDCMNKILPNGIGKCSETEELYGSKEKLEELNACYKNNTDLPDGSDWTTNPDFRDFKDGVSIIGVKCLAQKRDCKKYKENEL
ncbi:hypothetical protein HNY73_002838 [Argiope bruennichi]|uniref:DUF19 domain-containing protein n=1 Tax=Argiope bruennichi TaxID=94029 RepID=A0A8T0FUZ2_ARGBR|nr:hypothetical protein HNY73_002838 [Argiope bruennichi]